MRLLLLVVSNYPSIENFLFFDANDQDLNFQAEVILFDSIGLLKLERNFFQAIFKSALIIKIANSTLVSIDSVAFDDMSRLRGLLFYDIKFGQFFTTFKQNLSNPKLKRNEKYSRFDFGRLSTQFFAFTFNESFQVGGKKFCEFKDFPHDQLIVVYLNDGQIDRGNCLHLFLSLNNFISTQFAAKNPMNKNFLTILYGCHFDQKLNECYTKEGKNYEPSINFSLYIQDMAAHHNIDLNLTIFTTIRAKSGAITDRRFCGPLLIFYTIAAYIIVY